MSELVGTGLILLAASCAAFQRLFIKTSDDRMVFLVGVNLVSLIVAAIAMPLVPVLPPSLWPYLLLSSVFYSLAMYFLARAYRTGDFGIITPAQGAFKASLIAVLAILMLGETANRYHFVAIALLAVGFLIQVPWVRTVRDDHFRSVGFSLLIGGASAAQYTVDVFAVRATDFPLSYIVWNLLIGAPIVLVGFWLRGRKLWPQLTENAKDIAWGSGLDIVGYGIVLFVAKYLSLLSLIPLLNLDIVIAVLIGIFILREPFPRQRLIASLFLALAAITVALQ